MKENRKKMSRAAETRKKGSGGIIKTMVMIVAVIVIFSILVADAFTGNIKRQKIALEEAELFRVKNTFLLASKSLAETWRLSTIQAIFRTADSSMRCGSDSKGKSLGIRDGYWFMAKPGIPKTNDADKIISPAAGQKYNDANPLICGPRRNDMEDILNEIMQEFSAGGSFKANDLDVAVRDVSSSVKAEDREITGATQYELEVSSGGCENSVSCSKSRVTNISSVDTELALMEDAGRAIAYAGGKFSADGASGTVSGSLLGYSNAFNRLLVKGREEFENKDFVRGLTYQDIFSVPITNGRDDYLAEQKAILTSIIRSNNRNLGNSEITGIDFNKLELVSPCDSVVKGSQCEGGDVKTMKHGSGLALHYDITITMRDKDRFYYFHNTGENRFEKRHVELKIRAEDYLTALDCTDSDAERKVKLLGDANERIFNWESSKRELQCFIGRLLSCGDPGIKNFPQGNIIRSGNMPGTSVLGSWVCTAGGITGPVPTGLVS